MTGIKKLAKVTVSDFEETYYAQNRVNGLIVTGGVTLLHFGLVLKIFTCILFSIMTPHNFLY